MFFSCLISWLSLFFKKLVLSTVVHIFNPSNITRQRQADLLSSEANLIYRVISGQLELQRESLSGKTKQNKEIKFKKAISCESRLSVEASPDHLCK